MLNVTSFTVAGALALAGAAAASDGTATTTLTPDKAGAATAATVTVTGLSAPTGIPSSIVLTVQPGFTSSLKAVPVLCSSAQAATGCPAGSQVGTGSITASALGQTLTVPVKLFLGPPQQPRDISAVIVTGSVASTNLNLTGRVFKPAGGGLELSIDTSSLGSLPVTIEGVSISAHATQTKVKKKTIVKRVGKPGHKHKKKIVKRIKTVYSVLTNPPTCTGTWTGSLTLNYASGPVTVPLSTPCTK